MNEPTAESATPPVGMLAKRLIVTWLILGAMPIFSNMFGFGFLPSIEWVKMTIIPGYVAGVILAVLVLWLLWKHQWRFPITESKRVAILMIAPLFGFVLGRFSVIIAIPMILAWFAGAQVEYSYTIDSYELSCYKGCRWVLTLKGLPVYFDRILPSKRDKRVFQTDKHIIIAGRGTSWGVYAQNFRQVD